jgi:hypothetical protein
MPGCITVYNAGQRLAGNLLQIAALQEASSLLRTSLENIGSLATGSGRGDSRAVKAATKAFRDQLAACSRRHLATLQAFAAGVGHKVKRDEEAGVPHVVKEVADKGRSDAELYPTVCDLWEQAVARLNVRLCNMVRTCSVIVHPVSVRSG